MAQTDAQGTSVLGIVQAAMQLGIDAKGVKTNVKLLSLDIMPAIVHVIIGSQRNHFIVLHSITSRYVTVMDPADGSVRKMTVDEFCQVWTGVAILLSPGENFQRNGRKSIIQRIFQTARPHRQHLIAAGCCALLISGTGLILSFYVKETVDEILPRRQLDLLHILSGMVVTVLLIEMILNLVKSRTVIWVSRKMNESLILDYYRHVMNLPAKFFDNMRTGEIVSRVNDAAKISVFINELFVHLTVDVMVVIASVSFMFAYNWQISLVVALIIPVYLVLYALNNSINNKWQKPNAETAADFEAHLVESIGAAKTIKNLATEGYFINKGASKLKQLLDGVYQHSAKQLVIGSAADFSTKLFTVLLVWIGSVFILHGRLTTGELMAFYTLMAFFSMPVLNIINTNKMYGEAKVAAERLFEIFDLKCDDRGWKKLYNVGETCLAIELKNVNFRYGNGGLLLNNVNMCIRRGSITGISGKSGCGKSTLIALFVGSYPVTGGTVTVFGTDVNEIDRTCLFGLVSIAHQKADLFNMSIKENIMLGMEPDADRLHRLVVSLGIDEFTGTMPDGMDTLITERGENLSGGQRQRISIARAMYRQSPILILDEATSALDDASEEKIMQTIEWYRDSGNTVIIIAHNDTTLKICDNIAVLENGVIR